MSSLFGAAKQGAFGSTPSTAFGTNNTNQNTFSGFGAPQQPTSTSSLFGSTTGGGNTSGTTPSLFGGNPSTSTNNPSPFSQLNTSTAGVAAPTGNIFGTTGTTTNAPTTGLFGNTNNTTGTSLFGNASANTNTNTSTNMGLFGNTNTNTNTGAGTGTGSFGNTNTNTGIGTGTGLFGNTNTNTNTGIGAGLFGNANTNTQAPASGGLFGNPTQSNPTGGGLFGNAPGPATSNTIAGGGLFGGSSTSGLSGNANPSTNTGFGNTTVPLFGQTQQPPQQTQSSQPSFSMFGANASNQANKLGSNLFSSSNLGSQLPVQGLFGQKSTLSSSFLQTPSTSTSPANQQPDIQQRIEGIVAAWDPSSPQCRFQHYFYNLVDPNQVGLYGRPPNATNDALWYQAVRENPDPKCMVPVLAVGFDDLQKRVDAQSTQAKLHTEKLKELQGRIATLAQRHVLSTTRNTTRVLQAHTLINHRLLRLVEHVHLLIPNLRSAAISPEEESLRANLERLREELSSGNGRGRLNELWALLGAVKAAKEREGSGGMEWKVVDWDGLEKLAAILAEQQQGLAHLTSVINNGLKDLQIMEGGSQASFPESLNSSFLKSSGLGNSRR